MTAEDKAREIALKYTQLLYRDRNKWWDDLTGEIAQAIRDTERRVWREAAEVAESMEQDTSADDGSGWASGCAYAAESLAAALRARAGDTEKKGE